MVFSSFQFLFFFLPFVLLVNAFLPVRASNVFLLLASLVFYFVGEGLLTILLISSILWNYSFGLLLVVDRFKAANKWMLGICILGNLLLLIYFKYFGFIVESFGLGNLIPKSAYTDIVLPIGISFFTFQGISYILDVHRGQNQVERNLIRLGLYIAFFPQLVAGPIIKYNEIATFLSNRRPTLEKAIEGSFKFIRGLAKKVIIADSLAIFVDQVFIMDVHTLPGMVAALGLFCYGLQIYYDFSGYSDMAIGLGMIFGFQIPENFRHPYSAISVRDFWRKWHISLSTWFKNYLYIPMGGNRKGSRRTYFNLIIVFFVTGLWHGAYYNFIIWGLFHGFFLILERIPLFANALARLPKLFQHFYLLVAVFTAWVFFRIASFENAIGFFRQLFYWPNSGDYYPMIYWTSYFFFIVLLASLFTFPVRAYLERFFQKEQPLYFALKGILYLIVFIYGILELSIATHTPFIYFKF